MTFVRTYAPEDQNTVVNLQLRASDVDEILAATGKASREVVLGSLAHSEIAWVIVHMEQIVGVFGLCSARGCGIPWLLATDALSEFKYAFLKHSWDVIVIMLQRYPILTNFVDSRHTQAIQWLQWLGFKFLSTEHYLHDKTVPFKQFVMYREEQNV